MRLFLILLLTPMVAVALDLTDQQRADIESRIQPFSEVCVQGEACGGGEAMATSAGRSGEDVYNGACMACHAAGIAGAPRTGDKAAWADRIAQGADTLYTHAIGGFQGKAGVMPAKGGTAALSHHEVKAAVDHMVAPSQ